MKRIRIKKIFLYFAFLVVSVVLGGVALSVKGITSPTEEELMGYRPLLDSDIGKKFGVDLDNKIYFDIEYNLDNRYSSSLTVLMDFVVPDSSYLLKLDYRFEEGPDEDFSEVTIRNGSGNDYTNIYHSYNGFFISSYTLPDLSYINDIYYDLPKNFILIKDIEVESPFPDGYRPLLDSDVGKQFGVDLYSKIYFNLDYEVGYELFNGAPPGTADRILIDWVVPESSYRLELWSFFLDVEWEDRDLENMIFFSQGRNIGDNRKDVYYANFSNSPVSYGYVITDYTLPYKSYIYHIETDTVKNFILVKDLDVELSYDDGYTDGFEYGKRQSGLIINGIFYSGQDLYDYAFNKGLSDTESSSGIAVLVSGFFSSLAMFGNVEILPGLKIFYIVGFFLVIGLMMFLFKIRGK